MRAARVDVAVESAFAAVFGGVARLVRLLGADEEQGAMSGMDERTDTGRVALKDRS